jgi:hypothetical protein
MPDDKKMIEPIDAPFDTVAKAIVSPATILGRKNKVLSDGISQSPAIWKQMPLDLGIEVEKVIGGVEMGVLHNGIPYLTQRGLADACGAARSTVFEITQEWEQSFVDDVTPKGRISFFRDYLAKNGYSDPRLYIEISKNGRPYYAYPDVVCMAFTEFFAFEAQKTNEKALDNYRKFARFGLQQFIYQALGYTPEDKWKLFNARVSLLKDSVPIGYFSIFKESSGLAVDLISAGLTVNEYTMPDGSVGGTWGRYWTANNFDEKFGERIKYAHYFPSEYPQSASNPQEANAYPNEAWPEFQRWFRLIYLPTKYPNYILSKAGLLPGGVAEAKQLAAMYEPKQIEG